MLAPGLRAFYAELFISLDLTNAIDAMRAAAPEFGYFFYTAGGPKRWRHGYALRTVNRKHSRNSGAGIFLIDEFLEHDARFPLTYAQVEADAQKLAMAAGSVDSCNII